MSLSKRLVYSILFFLIGLALFFCASHLKNNYQENAHKNTKENFQLALHKAEQSLEDNLLKQDFSQLQKHQDYSYYLYVRDTLKRWTSHLVPIDPIIKPSSYSKICFLKNGWYLSSVKHFNDSTLVGLFKIKSEYPFENDYLQNDFSVLLDHQNIFDIAIEKPNNKPVFTLYTLNKTGAFYLIPKNIPPLNKLLIIDVLALLCICFSLWIGFGVLCSKPLSSILVFLSLLVFRGVSLLYYRYPEAFSSLDFFQNTNPQSIINQTLGDYLINNSLFILLVWIFYWAFRDVKKYTWFILFIVISIFSISFYQVYDGFGFEHVPLNPSDVSLFSFYSILVYISFGALLLLPWVFIKNIDALKSHRFSLGVKLLVLVFIICPFFFHNLFIVVFSCIGVVGCLFFTSSFHNIKERVNRSLIYLVIVAFFGSFFIAIISEQKKALRVDTLSKNLSINKDLSLEYNIENYYSAIQAYTNETLFEYEKQDLSIKEYVSYISDLYFSKFLTKYDLNVFVFEKKEPVFSSLTLSKSWGDLEKIKTEGIQNKNLPFLYNTHNSSDQQEYILDLYAPKGAVNAFEVSISFSLKSNKELIGYPVLLSEAASNTIGGSTYDFAHYKNGMLSYKKGDFRFPNQLSSLKKITHKSNTFNVFTSKEKTTVIYTKKKTLRWFIQCFSVLLFFLILSGFLFYRNTIFSLNTFSSWSLSYKFQITLILLLFISVITIGVGTYFTTKKAFDDQNTLLLEDKLRSILFEVEYKLSKKTSQDINTQNAYVEKILNKFSNVFYSDITLFDKSGSLTASSASSLFNRGILSKKIHPDAYEDLLKNEYASVIHLEHLGRLSFLSAYCPVYNAKNEMLGYLHLPYFVKQKDFEQRWGAFLSGLLNIYSLLLFALIVVSIFLSSYLTKPLRKLRLMLQNIEINSEDQTLKYDGENEIGKLAKAYNTKVIELKEQSKKLAETQKQMAWKEMAKQVAHEIKNPLTPMKLSTQHLLMSLQTKDTKNKEKLQAYTQRMIDQIDVLSSIASEFSDFASMPSMQLDSENLSLILKDIIRLNTPLLSHIDVQENIHLANNIKCDKNQMIRVFQNLLKNAIEALSETANAQLILRLEKQKNQAYFSITDNGIGIPPDIQTKIFTPNFTTKSKGKGLGLAMCKKIIDAHKGEIGFQSEKNKTVFYFTLPLS